MKISSRRIFGKLTDDEGRCEHYCSVLDIVANRCGLCGKFYACFKCHDELEEHKFCPVPADEENSVMCGACGKTYSYSKYSMSCSCNSCGRSFNPRCALHKGIYSK